MARDFSPTEYLESANAAFTAAPFTMAAWFKSNSETAEQSILSVGDASEAGEEFRLGVDGGESGNPVDFALRSGTTVHVYSSTGYTVGQWHHACGVAIAADDRNCYIDGGSMVNGTASKSPSGADQTRIGTQSRSSTGDDFDGCIAEAAIWTVALTDNEVKALAAGVSPIRIRRASLACYWPLYGISSPEIDYSGNGLSMTLSGTPPQADHAPVGPAFGFDLSASIEIAGGAPSGRIMSSLVGAGGLAGSGGISGGGGGLAG